MCYDSFDFNKAVQPQVILVYMGDPQGGDGAHKRSERYAELSEIPDDNLVSFFKEGGMVNRNLEFTINGKEIAMDGYPEKLLRDIKKKKPDFFREKILPLIEAKKGERMINLQEIREALYGFREEFQVGISAREILNERRAEQLIEKFGEFVHRAQAVFDLSTATLMYELITTVGLLQDKERELQGKNSSRSRDEMERAWDDTYTRFLVKLRMMSLALTAGDPESALESEEIWW